MGLRKLNSLILIGTIILSAVSCKEEDEGTVSPSLGGRMTFTIPEFVKPEATITLHPKGVTHPDEKELGYYWKVTPTMTKYDTTRFENGLDKSGNPSDGSFTHTFSDTLQTYVVYGYAFAEGYASQSASAYCTVVSGGVDESIKNLGIQEDTPYVTVDGKKLYYTTINGTDWLKTNLDKPSSGAPYVNCTAMNDVFGRFYSYEDAVKICPEGWTLPTTADWDALEEAVKGMKGSKTAAAALMANAEFNDTRMWEYWPEIGDITNESGISMIPVGYAMLGAKDDNPETTSPAMEFTYPTASFKGYKEYAVFWTADKVTGEEGMAYYRYLINKLPDLMTGKGDVKSFGASVRCVRRH